MLTSDLVRARVVKGVVRPSYLEPKTERLRAHAQELLALFDAQVGATQGALDEALADHLSEGGDLKIRRGLAKLLRDRCTLTPTVADADPRELRRAVFLAAGARHPVGAGLEPDDRAEVLAEVAAQHALSPEALEHGLYADLKEAHRLDEFRKLEVEALLYRYNVALAQGVLLRASEVRVDIGKNKPARYRQLFRFIKFYQLSFTTEPRREGGYRITLDGPLSLFRLVQRYGLRLAQWLPALLLCEGWRLEADVAWQEGAHRHVRFELEPDRRLRSHYRDTGVWTSEEETWFAKRFRARKNSRWSLRRAAHITSLGGEDVLVPDYILRHEDGRKALLEIIWSWRKGGLDRHLRHLATHGPPNLVLALSDKLRVGEEDVRQLPAATVRFKQVLRPKAVEDAAEGVAR